MAWIRPRTRKDGSTYFSVYYRNGGRQGVQHSISFDDYEGAQNAADLIEKVGHDKALEILRIVQSPRQSQSLAQFLLNHIDMLTGVERGTIARYRAYVRNDIADTIGAIPLTALSRDDVSEWVNEMQDEGVSGKTIKNKRDFLSGALKVAVERGVLKSNPCEGVKNPRWDRKEMVFLERDEFQLLLSCVTDAWKPLVEFLVASGCRWSEAVALRPTEVDLTAGTVRITKAWKTGGGGYELGVPKTTKSVRTVNIPKRILNQLDMTGDWVFTNSGRGKGRFADGVVRDDDGPVRIHNFHPNVWVPAVKRAKDQGLTKSPRVHDLRHTCASWLIQAGRPLPSVQAQMGHESIQTTSDVYGHLDRSSGQGNADAIDAMLS